MKVRDARERLEELDKEIRYLYYKLPARLPGQIDLREGDRRRLEEYQSEADSLRLRLAKLDDVEI